MRGYVDPVQRQRNNQTRDWVQIESGCSGYRELLQRQESVHNAPARFRDLQDTQQLDELEIGPDAKLNPVHDVVLVGSQPLPQREGALLGERSSGVGPARPNVY